MIKIKAVKNPKNQFQDWIENSFKNNQKKKTKKLKIGLKILFEIKNSTPIVNNMIVLTNVGQVFAFGGQKIPIPNLVVRTKLELSPIFRSFYLLKLDFIFLKKKTQNWVLIIKVKSHPNLMLTTKLSDTTIR